MNRVDTMTIAGLLLGILLVFGAIFIGGNIQGFLDAQALMITVGGSFAALLVNFNMNQIKQVIKVVRQVFFEKSMDFGQSVDFFYDLSQKARREGLLALEDDIQDQDDLFLKKGLQMMVDGMEPELISDVLRIEIQSMSERHYLGQELFRVWGALAPAFGMIGTLIGLIQMLAQLDDPDAIGPGMAVALLTTFYGALLANLFLIPMAGKLEIRSSEEIMMREAMLEGILGIQSGMNPRVLQDKLKSFIPPAEKGKMVEGGGRDTEEGMITDNV